MGASRYLVCNGGNMEGLVAATMFWDTSQESQLKAMSAISAFYPTAMWFFYNINTFVDITLQTDLVIILSEPFAPIDKRAVKCIIISIFLALIPGLAIYFTDFKVADPINQVLFYAQKVFFYISAFFSLSFTIYSYYKGGLSKQFRKLLTRRHASICVMTIFCQTTALINFLYITDTVVIPDWLQAICCYYFAFVVCILSILRLTEPIVWATFKKDLTKLCRRRESVHDTSRESFDSSESDRIFSRDARRGLEDSDILNDTLNMFLTSSLNVELVYTILTGIRSFVKEPEQATRNQGRNSTRISMDHIKIRNFECWEEVHQ